MTPTAARAAYKRALGNTETVTIRRYTGSGTNRPKLETVGHGKVVEYLPHEVVGPVRVGDSKLILLAEDFEAGMVMLPLLISDKAVLRGREMSIVAIDANTRRVGATLCAYEMQVRA